MLKRTLVTLVMFLSMFGTASAEQFLIEADGYHTVSRKETILEAEEAAVNDALRWAVEQIGVRISAYSEVINKVLKEDTVQRFASSVVKIREKTLTPKVMNDDYRIYAHVVCIVDTADLDKWEPPDIERQRKLEKDLEAERQRNKKLNNDLEVYQDFLNNIAVGKWVNPEERINFTNTMANYRNKKDYRGMEAYCENEINNGIFGEIPVWNALGEAQMKLGKYNEAKKTYEAILGQVKDSSASTIWEHLGDIYAIQGDYESARQAYAKAGYCPDKKAALAWNRGDYKEFANYLLDSHSYWRSELYSKWLIPDVNSPRHNHKINIKRYILQDGGASIPTESFSW